MSTEFFPADVPRDEQRYDTEIGVLVGGGHVDSPTWPAFCWSVHPEEGVRRVVAAGGARDAWGRSYTPAEFERMLRGCRVQVDEPPCPLRNLLGGR